MVRDTLDIIPPPYSRVHNIVRNIELLTDVVMNSNDDFLNMGIVNVGYGPNPMIRGYRALWPLGRVYFVKDALHNAISCRQLTRHGLPVNFVNDTATVAEWEKGKIIMTATT